MSRIGKKPITVPEKTEIAVSADLVSVKGPLGELSRKVPSGIKVSIDGNVISVSRSKENLETLALWGTTASHITNMIKGVNKAFEKKLMLEGIGYRAEVRGEKIVFSLGFSHQIEVEIPKGLKVTIEKNVISISGSNKEMVGGFTAKIRDLKKPEPYKGKGLRYEGEVIKIKQGKKSV
jgi:large subunit ribosomal protein L6